MAAPYLLGIDLGTTTCRAALFDLEGHEVAVAYRETPVQYPRLDRAEVDPEVWWRDATQVVRRVMEVGRVVPGDIAAVGLAGLMHAPVLLDGDGRPVVPAMLWMDQRCAPQCDALRRDLAAMGRRPEFDMAMGLSAPKLQWLAQEQPQALARTRMLMLPKDFIRYRLTGTTGTDISDAGGTGMFDREQGEWDWDVVALTGTPREIMPDVRPPAALAGYVTHDAAQATGLAPGTPVAVGGSDPLCTRLGVGDVGPEELCLYLGTAAWIAFIAGRQDDGQSIIRDFGATSTTGAALRWMRDLLAAEAHDLTASYEALTHQAAEITPGSEGLFFLPHLMGERGPQPEPLARGGLVGFTLRHGRPHVVRAVLEGTALHLRRLIEACTADRWPNADGPRSGVACGGAARSALWMQVLADVTRLEYRVPVVVEAAALGAAMLGGAAVGLLSLAVAPTRMVRIACSYRPEPRVAARYDRIYERYCALDDLLAPWYRAGGNADDRGERL
jgi:xylulokinase